MKTPSVIPAKIDQLPEGATSPRDAAFLQSQKGVSEQTALIKQFGGNDTTTVPQFGSNNTAANEASAAGNANYLKVLIGAKGDCHATNTCQGGGRKHRKSKKSKKVKKSKKSKKAKKTRKTKNH